MKRDEYNEYKEYKEYHAIPCNAGDIFIIYLT